MSRIDFNHPLSHTLTITGIGLQLTRLASAKGAKVIIGDLQLTPEAQQLVDTTETVIYQRCDVRNWADLHALIQLSRDKWNDVPDVYVASAGIFEPVCTSFLLFSPPPPLTHDQKWASFWEDTESTRYATVDINVNHPIKFTRLAIRALLGENKKGVVCLVSSISALGSAYSSPVYCASKHALWGFVKSMAPLDALEGVKVTSICPGYPPL